MNLRMRVTRVQAIQRRWHNQHGWRAACVSLPVQQTTPKWHMQAADVSGTINLKQISASFAIFNSDDQTCKILKKRPTKSLDRSLTPSHSG